MFKKLFIASLVIVGVLSVSLVAVAADNYNYVNVSACEQVGKDIRIKRDGKTYMLTSTCRDAGHGYRNYKMTCVSATQYKVEWTESCKPPVLPPPVVNPDHTAPSVKIFAAEAVYHTGDWVVVKSAATDNVGVTKLVLWREGSVVKTVYGSNLSYSFLAKEAGGYNFRVSAYDAAGNVGTNSLRIQVSNPVVDDNIDPVVVLSSDKKVYIEGEHVYLTARASDNKAVKQIVIYGANKNLLRTCYDTDICTADETAHFDASYYHNVDTAEYFVRAYDAVGNAGSGRLTVEIKRKTDNLNFTISNLINQFNNNGVRWLKIEAQAYADVGVSSVEIYLGDTDNKNALPLVQKCNYNNTTKNVVCELSFPLSLQRNGFFWTRAIAQNGDTKDSDLTYYNF